MTRAFHPSKGPHQPALRSADPLDAAYPPIAWPADAPAPAPAAAPAPACPAPGAAQVHPHLHRVHIGPHACRADQCRQGRAPCPVPQACEVPLPGAPHHQGGPSLHDERASPLETLGAFAVVVGLAAFAVWVIVWASSA